MNTVRKIHNLLSTGQVTVSTGTANNQRVLKQHQIQQQHNSSIVHGSAASVGRCYICDTEEGAVSYVKFHDLVTNHSSVKFPNKIGQIIGSNFMVIVSVDDLICQRCVNLINNYDRFETEAEKYKSTLLTSLNKKYDLALENNSSTAGIESPSPPVKMQKLTPTNANIRRINMNDSTGSGDEGSVVTRKIAISNDDENKQVSTTVRQINIPTQKVANQQVISTQPAKKPSGSIKIYKCVSCDYKTPDLKNFQTHYEDCRIKNAQCRICKKIFANANVMKQHMQEKHPNAQTTTTTILYNCSQCQFQTTDKVSLEEHLKTHSKKVVKVKPFKCRLCSMRFESREQATIHAKSHQQAHQAQTQQQQQAQQTYFKCGACSATFPQKDLLVKHFETHRKPQQQPQNKVVQHVDKTKLLQDTIEEALREPKEEVATAVSSADANKINFFSCNICSLTFLQETYYNSHMETHKQKSSSVVASASTKTPIVSSRISSQTTAADIKVDVPVSSDIESIFEKMHSDEGDAAGSASKTEDVSGSTTSTNSASKVGEKEKPQVGIDMPTLDLGEEQSSAAAVSTGDSEKKKDESQEDEKTGENEDSIAGPPVSMPSLDDDGESTNATATENPTSVENQQIVEEQMETDEKDGEPQSQEEVPQEEGETTQEENVQQDEEHQNEEGEQEQLTQMELDGIEGVEGGNIKFIINENGQLIQLDENHILTTDADGNQILVQGAGGDSEHIQQLLQSVGAFAEGDGSGQQMVLVQGEGDSEPQLIDASQLINADGHHIVIQQGDEVQLEEQEQDGETVAVSYADA
ncbi:hypothetical protein ACFFRR_009539 [Megaselia abdita]